MIVSAKCIASDLHIALCIALSVFVSIEESIMPLFSYPFFRNMAKLWDGENGRLQHGYPFAEYKGFRLFP